ncbi:MAG TPA: phage holin family protein [Candidatus Didemnitutus sp.]|nr:phage holin family protein [Candidatus Didemnitutus sp.]
MAAQTFTSASMPHPHIPPAGVALSLLVEGSVHRAELAVLELSEARGHVTRSLLLAAGTGTLVLLAGFALTLLIAALVWASPQREWWLAGIALVYVLAAVLAAVALRRRLQLWRPLAEIQHQLSQDCACLRQLLSSHR